MYALQEAVQGIDEFHFKLRHKGFQGLFPGNRRKSLRGTNWVLRGTISRAAMTGRGEVPMLAADGQIYEYACHEGNYGMTNLLAGAWNLGREQPDRD